MSNDFIWPIDRTISGVTTPGQCEPGSNANEEVLHRPQSSNITEASTSDSFVLYLGHLLRKSYSFAEIPSVYSAALTDLTKKDQVSNFGL